VSAPVITRIEGAAYEAATAELGELLAEVVNAGASVGFLRPLSATTAAAWWRSIGDGVRAGHIIVLLARVDGRCAGTVQLRLAAMPNQTHRADVAKMLVHPAMRRRGMGAALMSAIEREARQRARMLLVLDTESGSEAERFYSALGWARAGLIPRYAKDADGAMQPTTIFYKELA
jgi:GNAT superfamily N-acetyltransferase